MQNYKSPPTGNIGENLGDLGFGLFLVQSMRERKVKKQNKQVNKQKTTIALEKNTVKRM